MVHVFVDGENFNYRLYGMGMTRLIDRYGIDNIKTDIVASPISCSPSKYQKLFPCNYISSMVGKNSADTVITACIAKVVYEEKETDTVAIMSNDKDFIPAIQLIIHTGKTAILIANDKGAIKCLQEHKINAVAYHIDEDKDTIKAGSVMPLKIHPARYALLLAPYRKVLRTVWLKGKDGLIYAVPFYGGIPECDFMGALHDKKKLFNMKNKLKFFKDNYIKRMNKRLYFYSDVELAEME